jgi:CTP:molybdopterin cytidylyltransferase MocA
VIASAAIVLAAGASSRIGRPKALLTVEGDTFATRIAATARAAGVARVVYVLGPPHGDAVRAALPADSAVAWNPDPARGMLTSIQAGVRALQHDVDAALIWPVDQPLVSVATVRLLVAAPQQTIAVPQHGSRGGHPVRIPRALFDQLLALAPDEGLRGLLQRHADRVLRIAVDDPRAVEDIDTEADYRRLVSR